jgi:hypothetical protein
VSKKAWPKVSIQRTAPSLSRWMRYSRLIVLSLPGVHGDPQASSSDGRSSGWTRRRKASIGFSVEPSGRP